MSEKNIIAQPFGRYNFILAGVFCAVFFWLYESYKHAAEFPQLSFMTELISPDMHELWMRLLTVFLFLFSGISSHILLNKARKAEKEAHFAHSELDQIFQTAASGMRVVDLDHTIIRVNKTFLSMAGLPENDVVGQKCYEIFHGAQCHTPDCPLTRVVEGEERVEYGTDKKPRDGEAVPCIVTATPYRETDNKLLGIVEDFRDVSELKRGEKEKTKLKKELKQAQKMEAIGTLAGGIAHDFNNILTAILGYAGMAKEDISPESRAYQDIGVVIKSGNRAKELVRQILAFSRQSEEELQPLKIQFILKEALQLLRSSIPTTIQIRQNIDSNCAAVLADPAQVHQVVMNLCTNGYHAMQDTGGTLSVSLSSMEVSVANNPKAPLPPVGFYIKLEVSDTGHGMDATLLGNIFEPYFTTKEKSEGTGLGLAVVHGIVKGHGGYIDVHSETGKGTTFDVYFPQIPVREEILPSQAKKDSPLPRGHEHILVVDDEETISRMVQQILQSLGYRVTAFTDSTEALGAFKKQSEKFDLIIMDMTMPRMTGADLARAILAVRPDIPIILCTGYSDLIDKKKATAIGIREYILKPLDKKNIAECIRKLLDESEHRTQDSDISL